MKMATTKKFALLLICMVTMASAWAADENFRSAEGGLRIQDLEMGQGQGAVVGQVDPTARMTTGRKTSAEVLAEDQLRGMTGGEVTAVHRNELTGGAS